MMDGWCGSTDGLGKNGEKDLNETAKTSDAGLEKKHCEKNPKRRQLSHT